MEITKNGSELTVKIEGKFDRTSAPIIETEIAKAVDDSTTKIIFDLEKAVYVSSAGLRVILSFEKKMRKSGGKMVVRNVPELVMEVFTETGLTDILTLE